jgi:hypothetical protein
MAASMLSKSALSLLSIPSISGRGVRPLTAPHRVVFDSVFFSRSDRRLAEMATRFDLPPTILCSLPRQQARW